MLNNKRLVLLFIIVLITTMGILSATNVTTTDKTHETTLNTQNNQYDAYEKTIPQNNTEKTIKKEIKTPMQTKTQSYSVNSYSDLTQKITAINRDDNSDSNTIILGEGNYTITTPLVLKGGSNSRTLTLEGNGATIDGNNIRTFMNIPTRYTVILNNIIINNCNRPGDGDGFGGAISNNGTLIIRNSSFNNNWAELAGGVINNVGDITVVNSSFNNNVAGLSGGVIRSIGNLTVVNSTFYNNSASGVGGVIDNGGNLEVQSCIFKENSGRDTLINDYIGDYNDPILNVHDCTFIDNAPIRFTKNTDTNKIELNEHRYVKVSSYTVLLGDTEVFTGTSLDEYTLPELYGSLKVVVNSDVRGKFRNNTYILEENRVINVNNYDEFVDAINIVKSEISLVTGLTYIINLHEGDYNITTQVVLENTTQDVPLIIEGNGVTIDGNNNKNFIKIGRGYSVNFHNININNCNSSDDGAAILNYGILTINNSSFRNNVAKSGGAICSRNKTTIVNSTFDNNKARSYSGAVYNDRILTVNSSIFTNNEAIEGGAITSGSEGISLEVFNSSFSNNVATSGGAAVYTRVSTLIKSTDFINNSGRWYAGAIYNNNAEVTVIGSRFINNTAETGGVVIFNYRSGTSNVFNSTYKDNSPVHFIKNTTTNKIQLLRSEDYINVGSFSVFIDDEEVYTGNSLNDYTVPDVVGSLKIVVNGADTGKFYNNTFILEENRVINVNNYDELVNAINIVKREISSVTGLTYIINLHEGDYNITTQVVLENTTQDVHLIIEGNGVTIDGNNNKNFIKIGKGYSVNFYNININNCNLSDSGAAIRNYGILTIKNSSFRNNAAYTGGAIYSHNKTTIVNSTFDNNKALSYSGAVDNQGILTVNSSIFTNNEAIEGGAITSRSDGISLEVFNSSFSNNVATSGGAAVYTRVSTLIKSTDFINNSGRWYAGAIYNYNAEVTVIGSRFINNTAETGGVVIFNYNGGTSNVFNSTYKDNSPVHFVKNTTTNKIQLLRSEDYINVGSFSVFIDDEEVYTGNSLNDYTVPDVVGSLKIVVNGADTDKFYNNTFILEEDQQVINVNNYDELVNAIELIKGYLNKESFVINLLNDASSNDYNATSNIIWGNTSSILKLVINGNNNTLNGLNKYQFMNITEGYKLVLNNITLTNYTAGNGGVFLNYGELTINNSRFINNTAVRDGGVMKSYDGSVNISNSVFEGNKATSYNGGVVFNDKGTLNVFNSTFTQNRAGYNGGVFLSTGNMTINNSTFMNNTSSRDGGVMKSYDGAVDINSSVFEGNVAIYNGGVVYNNGTMNINNSVFNNNKATMYNAGAAYNDKGTLNIFNSTFTQNRANYNGGAFVNTGNMTINDSVITDNTAVRDGGALKTYNGTVNISNSVFEGNKATSYNGGAVFNDKGTLNVFNSTFTQNRAGYNGGVFLSTGNMTINNSTFMNNTSSRDGGVMKSYDGAVDINSSVFEGNVAIYNGGVVYNNGTMNINNSVFNNNKATMYNAGVAYNDKGTLNVFNSTFTQNRANYNGGAFVNTGNMTINDSVITDNTAVRDGGALKTYNGTVNISNSVFERNNATSYNGGAAFNDKGTLNVFNSTFTQNKANFNGGVFLNTGNITINNSTFMNNTSSRDGAVMKSYDGTAIINASKFEGNTADYNGGVAYNNGTMKIFSSIFNGNTAKAYNAGVIYNDKGTLNVFNSTFTQNRANYNGGAFVNTGNMTINDSVITDNTAVRDGGAIKTYDGIVDINNSVFERNNATTYNGGVAFNDKGTLNVFNSTFTQNKANYNGGVFLNTGNMTINNSTFMNNTSSRDGGVLKSYDGTVNINNSLFKANTATYNGGVNYNDKGTLNIFNSTFIQNTAKKGGANYYVGDMNKTPDTVVNGTYINNTATYGGANYFSNFFPNVTMDGTYLGNNATYGGANSINAIMENLKLLGKFINNTAGLRGGANYFEDLLGNIENNATFENNHAPEGSDNYVCSQGDDEVEFPSSRNNLYQSSDNEIESTDITSLNNIKKNSVFNNNKATMYNAGAAYNDEETLNIFDSTFTQNRANYSDAAFVNTENMTINDSVITDNTAVRDGGALKTYNGTVDSNNSVFDVNLATSYDGGAAYNDKGTLNIFDSTFAQNSANYSGAAFVNTGNMAIDDSVITDNAAVRDGGAPKTYDDMVDINDSVFDVNLATSYDGGVAYNDKGTLNIFDSTFTQNNANYNSGANVGDMNKTPDTVINGTYINNTATYDGANTINAIMENPKLPGKFINNTAGLRGGANYFEDLLGNIENNATFENNHAPEGSDNYVCSQGDDEVEFPSSRNNLYQSSDNEIESTDIISFNDITKTIASGIQVPGLTTQSTFQVSAISRDMINKQPENDINKLSQKIDNNRMVFQNESLYPILLILIISIAAAIFGLIKVKTNT